MQERVPIEPPSDEVTDVLVLLVAAPDCEAHPGAARRVVRERSTGVWSVECAVAECDAVLLRVPVVVRA